jgi:hypothetical protein
MTGDSRIAAMIGGRGHFHEDPTIKVLKSPAMYV